VEIDGDAVASGLCPWKKEPPESLFNTAPLDQRFDQPFEGEMTLSLRGMVADAPWDVLINLPEMKPMVTFTGKPGIEVPLPCCDTLVIDTDLCHIHLLWRSALPFNLETPSRGQIVLRDLVAEAEAETEANQERKTAPPKTEETFPP
jgi:hypothetical protein